MQATAAGPAMVLRGRLDERTLAGAAAIVTGSGGGIGLEAARSLLELGAGVAVAEIDRDRCSTAAGTLAAEYGPDRVLGYPADISDEGQVRGLVDATVERFGKVDAVVNNATFSPAGNAVVETPVADWDRSYAVNLRGPALLARRCVPAMIGRHRGAFVCVSSTGGPFLSSYETLKAAQVALANSLDAELEGTGVSAFTIGPGLVPTATATAAIERLAPRLGMTVDEFWRMNRGAVLSVEAAGAGFAAAVAFASRYAGQEISSAQALVDAGIVADAGEPSGPSAELAELTRPVVRTLQEQAAGWKTRSFFERQWMLRDFKQRVGLPVEGCLEMLSKTHADRPTLEKLARFYRHLGQMAAGYVKDPAERDRQVALVATWADEVDRLIAAVGG